MKMIQLVVKVIGIVLIGIAAWSNQSISQELQWERVGISIDSAISSISIDSSQRVSFNNSIQRPYVIESEYAKMYPHSFSFTPDGDILIWGNEQGIYRSSDNGNHWIFIELPGRHIKNVVLDHSGGFYVLTHMCAGTYYCNAHENMFHPLSNTTMDSIISALAVTPSGELFAGTDNYPYSFERRELLTTDVRKGLYRSTDHGSTWVIETTYPENEAGTIECDSSGILYISCGSNFGKLYKSNPSHKYWSKLNYGSFIKSIYSANDSTIYLTTLGGMYFSIDSGKTFTQCNEGLHKTPVDSLQYIPGKGVIGLLDSSIVFLPAGKRQWHYLLKQGAALNSIRVHSGYIYVYFNYRYDKAKTGLYRTPIENLISSTNQFSDAPPFWNIIGSLPVHVDQRRDNYVVNKYGVVFMTAENKIYVSRDTCASWNVLLQNDTLFQSEHYIIQSLAINPINDKLYLCFANHLLESNDEGKSWNQIYRFEGEASRSYQRLVIDSNGIFVVVKKSSENTSNILMISKTNGRTWNTINTSLSTVDGVSIGRKNNIYINQRGANLLRFNASNSTLIRVNKWAEGTTDFDSEDFVLTSGDTYTLHSLGFTKEGDILAAVNRKIMYSKKNGNNWIQKSKWYEYIQVFCTTSGGTIFAGTKTGVIKSVDNGKSWEMVNIGLTTTDIVALIYYPKSFLYAFTFKGDIFRSVNKVN